MATILITGGAGFIGSNFVRHMVERHPDYRLVVLDALTYAGSLDNLPPEMRLLDHPTMTFWYGDVRNAELVNSLVAEADYVVHFAAETHVTRSIFDNRLFFETDVIGTHTVWEKSSAQFEVTFVYPSDHLGPPDRCIFRLRHRSVGEAGIFTQATPRTDIQIVPHRPVQLRPKQTQQFFPLFFIHDPHPLRFF